MTPKFLKNVWPRHKLRSLSLSQIQNHNQSNGNLIVQSAKQQITELHDNFDLRPEQPKHKILQRSKPPPTTVTEIPYADRPKQHFEGQKVGAEEVRDLCELIRKRYALDIDLWDLRQARERDREDVRKRIEKAEATLAKIRRTVEAWDRRDLFESDKDWRNFQNIKERIFLQGKRDWVADPPWSEE